uniref:Uncharacterized protein MANES_14G171800 n=1 Tax=Rhizophora mucronata TaxID=61149 RepID=A0A2P2KSH3_RHIMU
MAKGYQLSFSVVHYPFKTSGIAFVALKINAKGFFFCFLILTTLHALLISLWQKGFDKMIWGVAEHKKGKKLSITFKYHSCDEEEVALSLSFTLLSL